MIVMGKEVAHIWKFKSDTSDKFYETIQYKDGSTSCECRGWTMHNRRSCKHTRSVEDGTADASCENRKDFTGSEGLNKLVQSSPSTTTKMAVTKTKYVPVPPTTPSASRFKGSQIPATTPDKDDEIDLSRF